MTSEDELRRWVRQHLAHLLHVAPDSVALDRTLSDYGLDSVDGVLMAGELEEAFRIEVDPAVFMTFDTFEAMIIGLSRTLQPKT
jgi:acyl carrier protein